MYVLINDNGVFVTNRKRFYMKPAADRVRNSIDLIRHAEVIDHMIGQARRRSMYASTQRFGR